MSYHMVLTVELCDFCRCFKGNEAPKRRKIAQEPVDLPLP